LDSAFDPRSPSCFKISTPQEGLILSVFFDDQNGTESPLFTHFGFSADGSGNSPSKSWDAPHYIDVAKVR
jgi:hypothetical protein